MTKKIRSSEITPEAEYGSRRRFLKAAGAAAGAMLLGACAPAPSRPTATRAAPGVTPLAGQDELGDPQTAYEAVTSYTNYYEFSTNKQSASFARPNPGFWALQVASGNSKPSFPSSCDKRKWGL